MPGGYVALAVGAFLDFAIKVNPVELGINFHTLGVILITVGALSVIMPLISNLTLGFHRRTVIEDDVVRGLPEDDRGYVLRRGETTR